MTKVIQYPMRAAVNPPSPTRLPLSNQRAQHISNQHILNQHSFSLPSLLPVRHIVTSYHHRLHYSFRLRQLIHRLSLPSH